MKSIIGFSIGEEISESPALTEAAEEITAEEKAVRSVVGVRFESSGMLLNYYNDKFDLRPGDRVFVSGTKYGECGTVEKISTSFRIDLKKYQKVIARPVLEFHGEYEHCLDKMVTMSPENIHPDMVRGWLIPPALEGEETEIVEGEGYTVPLDTMEQCELIEEKIAQRAMDYCNEGKVKYISLQNGVGTAFVSGTRVYEIDFRFDGETVLDLFCDCPYPFLCKHTVAALVQFRALWHKMSEPESFAAIDSNFFWDAVRHSEKISL